MNKKMERVLFSFFVSGLLGCLGAVGTIVEMPAVQADEGMWLYSNPPKEQVKERYGFELTDDFLEHLQKSSIRFANNGSASFVSSNGLIMTNHHVAVSVLQKMSTKENDYVKTGYYAKTEADELPCPDVELNVLMGIEDVTAKVNEAVNPEMTSEESEAARRAVMNQIEQESFKKTGFKSEVMSLYQGGLYHLYQYKVYTDVRLVFAPEKQTAFMGGDPDNFEYPRFDLDVSFFRAYEADGKPAHPEHFLKWASENPKDGDLVFVSGHPGKTDRYNTVDHLIFQRDVQLPYMLTKYRRQEVLLQAFGARNIENARRIETELFRFQNSRKSRTGVLAGLQDPKLLGKKIDEEIELLTAIDEQKLFSEDEINPYEQIASSLDVWANIYDLLDLIENSAAFNSQTYRIAKTIVRLAEESEKPNAERLREYRESAVEGVKAQILSPVVIDEDIEILKLTDSLGMYLDFAGGFEYPFDEENPGFGFLNGLSPKERAISLVKGSKLRDVAERKKLLDGGLKAVTESDDPMIQLALLVDPVARELRAVYDSEVQEPMSQAYNRIAQARFKIQGDSTYPDATFSLRLSYGKVAGYTEDDGTKLPAWTNIGGLYKHSDAHQGIYPFNIEPSWIDAKPNLDLETPFNIVTTNDIIGGNSGSPLVNSKGEVVGLIFDGNIQSLVLNFTFEDVQARATSVTAASIMEALRNVYKIDKLADELGK